jgi:diadenylate cyclase
MVIFHLGYIPFRIIDILDILIVAYVFYKIYMFLRGTFASRMFLGLFVIMLAGFLAQTMDMSGVNWLMDNVKTVWVVAFVIVFQPELRRILLYLGQNRLISRFVVPEKIDFIEQVVEASEELSEKNYGALIVFARNSGLRSFVETGIEIQSKVTKELLLSIFNPRSPLHDGAVIIRNDVITAARCVLPLSQNPRLDPTLGTRHRAGLGLSEISDALVVIVSEETGKISVAEEGILNRGLNRAQLRDILMKGMSGK